jgi:peptidoglycan/LPS O-acetylase OafA/YrhL
MHLFWAGTEAVYVFFVLSGFVLTLATESLSFEWTRYYPQRLLRLYLPVAAAVGWAVLTMALVSHDRIRGASWWLNAHYNALTARSVFDDLTLVRHTTWLNSALWSLKWEVYFSALLPVYILVVRRVRWRPWVLAVPLVAAISAGAVHHHDSVLYLPMFGLGVLMATHRRRLTELGSRLRRRDGLLLVAVTVLLLTAPWMLDSTLTGNTSLALVGVQAIGAALTVFLVWSWPPARELGETSPMQWLGTRSFSIYLIHEPIVVSTAYLLGGRMSALITLAIVLPVTLLAAQLFFVYLEGPAHRLARAVARYGRSSTRPVLES